MADFSVVLLDHGYGPTCYERDIITQAGGRFIDAQDMPLDQALKLCEKAQGILTRRMDITRRMIRRFSACKIIERYGVGTDNIDPQAATEAGIIVGNVPDYCIDEVSSHAIALLLSCVRDIVGTHKKIVAGQWDVRRPVALQRLAGRTLGLVGLGQIGRAVARKMEHWGISLLASDPFVEQSRARELHAELVDLETLCRRCDYISLHVPLLPETRHLLSDRQFAIMKPGTILVNTARGPIVDTRALLKALDSGKVARAGLDVFEQEPPPKDSPLLSHPAVTLTDHLAWHSQESQVQLQTLAARTVVTVCQGGLPSSLSNPQVIERLGRLGEWQPGECMIWQLKRMKLPHNKAD